MEDTQLIDRIIRKDEQAFREFVEKYQSLVFNTCYGFVDNKDDAEDLAQDVFIEVYKSIKKFRRESKLSTWLYRISINKSLNFINRNKKFKITSGIGAVFSKKGDLEFDIPDDKINQADEVLENEDRKTLLTKAINSLPNNQRIAFNLSKNEDLSYKEIADVMSLSISSVESLLFRAKKNLQARLLAYYKNI